MPPKREDDVVELQPVKELLKVQPKAALVEFTVPGKVLEVDPALYGENKYKVFSKKILPPFASAINSCEY